MSVKSLANFNLKYLTNDAHLAVTQKSSSHTKKLSLSNREIFAVFNNFTVQFTRQRLNFLFHICAFDGLPNNLVVVYLKRI